MGALITEVALGYHINLPVIPDYVLIPFLLFALFILLKGLLRIFCRG